MGKKLIKATTKGNLTKIAQLLESGEDVNEKDGKGWFPLGVAAARGYIEAIPLLLENGAEELM